MAITDFNENDYYSLRSKVFQILQKKIINGEYESGESLTEKRLSEDLDVSRTPIREALRQLELEGLVQAIPNKGIVVLGVSRKDIEDIYTIRLLIEGLASKWAAERITDDELKELKSAVDLEEFYTTKNDVEQLLRFDSIFHQIIYKSSNSKPLMHLLKSYLNHIERARNESFRIAGRPQKSLEEHKAIYKAISEHKADLAEKLTYEHINNAKNNFLNNSIGSP